jgi:mandelate racemase
MNAQLIVQSTRVRSVDVPISPLRTATGIITSCPLVLIDVFTDQNVVGRSYVFAYSRTCLRPLAELVQNLAGLLVKKSAAPINAGLLLSQSFRLIGTNGIMAMALGGLDMALWDAQAKAREVPLVTLLGGEPRAIPVYWSVGMSDPADARDSAARAIAQGCKAMKIKIGYRDFADDLASIRAVREVGGSSLQLMVDYNQSLLVAEAKRRIQRLEEHSLDWIEEPTLSEDFRGHAEIAREASTPIQLGENWSSVREMSESIALSASDLAMVDVMKIGGVTGWLRAAALAQVSGLPVSSHIFPEISAHLLAVTPTAQWLEYLDLASAILKEPARIENGCVTANASPGSGIEWNEEAIEKYAVA